MARSDVVGVCWFCVSPGPQSLEHVFPDWLNGIIPGQAGPPYEVRETQRTEAGEKARDWLKSGPATEKVKSVCKQCNNGWLSQLESDAKPLLTPLVRGEAANLTIANQTLVAAWATKTAFVIESRNPPEQFVSLPGDRALLRAERRPPANIQVDAFVYSDRTLSAYRRCSAAVGRRSDERAPTDEPNYAVTIMMFGCLGLRVVQDKEEWHKPLTGDLAPIVNGVKTIWPTSTEFQWPPSQSLNDAGAQRLFLAPMPKESTGVDPTFGPTGTREPPTDIGGSSA